MNTLKTIALAVLLSAAAYGVYVAVMGGPPSEPPKEAAENWEEGAEVEMPSAVAQSPGSGGETAHEPHVVRAEGDSASPFRPGDYAAGAPPFVPAQGGSRSLDANQDRGDDSVGADALAESTGGLEPDTSDSDERPAETASNRYKADEGYPSNADGQPSRYSDNESLEIDPRVPTDGRPRGSGERSRDPDEQDQNERRIRAEAADVPSAPSAEIRTAYDTQLPRGGPGGGSEFEAAIALAQSRLDRGELAEAHLALSQWFGDPRISTDEEARLLDLLDQLAGTVVYSHEHLLEPPYEVQSGDTLESIAEACSVPWELLSKINGVSPQERLKPGRVLKVVRGPFDAVVDMNQFRLTLFLHSRYAGRFSIGIGQDHATPEGEFVVLNKVKNPTYFGPEQVIDGDDPANPLGELAIDLGNHTSIHGTQDPASLNRAGERGSIRLSAKDIEDVFDILTAQTDRTDGSRVVIRR